MLRRRRAVARAMLAAGAAIVGWALLIEPRRLVLRRRAVRLGRWPATLDGLRVAVVGDLHAGVRPVDAERVAGLAGRLARTRPDLAVLLGDFVDAHARDGDDASPERVAAALGALGPPLGTVAVLGNHDWVRDGERVRAALARHGIAVLENAARPLPGGLWVAGLADAATREPDLERALAAVPAGAPLLVLTHHPDVFPRVPGRAALTLAGHTHGGQVNLPGLRAWAVPSRFGDRYAHGLTEERGRLLYVTSGVGHSRRAVRLRRPPEAVLLTLRCGRRGDHAAARPTPYPQHVLRSSGGPYDAALMSPIR